MTGALELPSDAPPAGVEAQTLSDPLHLLMLLCARPQDGDCSAARIQALAESGPDWAALLAAAADHGVAPLVCHRLETLAGEALPPLWRKRFQVEFDRNTRRNLFLAGELFAVLDELERRGVRAVPFKGPVLAAQAYGDVALRQFADLDILLPQQEIVEAHRALESWGFHPMPGGFGMPSINSRIPGQYAYRRDPRGTLVELHTERTLRYLPVPLDWADVRSRLETVSVGGQPVRTCSLEDTILLLCVHGSKHCWSRLGWICDIAGLVQVPQGLDWARLESLAQRMGCRRIWLLGLALASDLLQAPLPARVLQWIRSDAGVAALSRCVQTQFLTGGESAAGAPQRAWFRIQSQETFGQGMRQLCRVTTRPTEDDWHSHRLPRWIAPLYAALRPWRLLRDHGLGLRRKPTLP